MRVSFTGLAELNVPGFRQLPQSSFSHAEAIAQLLGWMRATAIIALVTDFSDSDHRSKG
jgi:hypothetical protein